MLREDDDDDDKAFEDAGADEALRVVLAAGGHESWAAALVEKFGTPSSSSEMALPTSLTSKERHACHAWCEVRGFASRSSGDGDERFVSVCGLAPARDGEQWCRETLAALEEERKAETAEVADSLKAESAASCVSRGVSVMGLRLENADSSGPGGRTRLTLRTQHGGTFAAHRLNVRSEVNVTSRSGQAVIIAGIVKKATDMELEVLSDCSLEEALEGLVAPLRLDARVNEATYTALAATAKNLQAACSRPAAIDDAAARAMRAALMGSAPPPAASSQEQEEEWIDESLDDSQKSAVRFARDATVALIHGPPGTGKTRTIVELIVQCALRGERVLACAPSNVAVDNMLERVAKCAEDLEKAKKKNKRKLKKSGISSTSSLSVLRLGHPSRLSEAATRHSLETSLKAADGAEVLEDARQELKELQKTASKGDPARRRTARREAQAVRAELRKREDLLVVQLLSRSSVVFATNVGAHNRLLDKTKKQFFDLVVIDEAAMALEVSCWIPLLRGRRCVLAGDHKQLAPTIKSAGKTKSFLENTLFERLMSDRRPGFRGLSRMLRTQYRMHADISNWASQAMYNGRLRAAESCAGRDLADLVNDEVPPAMLVIDTAGCDFKDDSEDDREHGAASVANPREAAVAVRHVQSLLVLGMNARDVCVIAPYNAQVACLRDQLAETCPGVEARTVDGYQGGEREAVVLSLTRSNAARAVGFLGENRRLNVAVTRARRHVAIICDSGTVRSDPFIAGLLDHVESHGHYRYALDDSEAVGTEVTASFSDVAPPPRLPPVVAAARVAPSEPPSPPDAAVKEEPLPSEPAGLVVESTEEETVEEGSDEEEDEEEEEEEEEETDEDCFLETTRLEVGFAGARHPVDVALKGTVRALRVEVERATGVDPRRQKLIFAGATLDDDDQRLCNAMPGLKEGSRLMLLARAPAPTAPPVLSKNAKKKASRKQRTTAVLEAAPEPVVAAPPEKNNWLAELAKERAARGGARAPPPEPPTTTKQTKKKQEKKKKKKQQQQKEEEDDDQDEDGFLDAALRARQAEKKADPSTIWKRWIDADGVLHQPGGQADAQRREKLAGALQAKINKERPKKEKKEKKEKK